MWLEAVTIFSFRIWLRFVLYSFGADLREELDPSSDYFGVRRFCRCAYTWEDFEDSSVGVAQWYS